MKNLIYGFGLNDATYTVTPSINGVRVRCPYYTRWVNMIQRAYSPTRLEKDPSYLGVTVCDEWKSFTSFKEWMMLQDWEGKELDKDILYVGNKIYSPDTCCFVPHYINALLVGVQKRGYSYDEQANCYRAQINIKGKGIYLGAYTTEQDARTAYTQAKINYLESFYPSLSSGVVTGLSKHVQILKDYHEN